MRLRDLLRRTVLQKSDAEVLLARLLKRDRSWLFAHDDEELPAELERTWREWETRRGAGEPIAYMTGQVEFYGRPFAIRRGALVPRPSTEGLIETALAWLHAPSNVAIPIDMGIVAFAAVLKPGRPTTVVDCGTGSGVIAITLALERPELNLIATDISNDALHVAEENARLHQVHNRIDFRFGSLLEPVADLREPFLLVSNPPYVPSGRELPRDITEFEPKEAIFAGPEGLDVLKPLIEAAREHPACCGFVVECEEGQI
jgi:release factor glutamine methyltransferase